MAAAADRRRSAASDRSLDGPCAADRSPDRSTPLLNRHHSSAGGQTVNGGGVQHHPLAAAAAATSGATPPPVANHSLGNHLPGNHPVRSAPLASPRTHIRETTKDIVTAVTHQDINGLNAVSTVALKDIDVQMSALSGYETYV